MIRLEFAAQVQAAWATWSSCMLRFAPMPGLAWMLRLACMLGRARVPRLAWVFGLAWVVGLTFGAAAAQAQNLSWVKGAIERSKQAPRESVPLWQYDPRIAAGSGDASLRSVASATADRIFAVGDRGLILASPNGGRTWTQIPPQTTLNLYAIAFISERQGFIVGGNVQPLSRTSLGIVLATDDGGDSWRKVNDGSLPRLTGLAVGQRGVLTAWGDWSPQHASAVVESHDYGRSWQGVASPLGHLQCVARQAGGLQLGVDRAGRSSTLPARPDHPLNQLASPTLPITALVHTGSQWIAAGSGGTLAVSRDAVQWSDGALPLSPQARAACQFRCLTSIDRHVWAAGFPGSVLFHSEDYGNTWQVQPSDQSWPINAIHFFDLHRGWAVTDCGSILATRDGGKSWFIQRQPVERLGMQAFASVPGAVSWPALAEATWQSRQATSLAVVHRENNEDAVDFQPDTPSMLAAAGTQAGLVSALQTSKHPLDDARVRDQRRLAMEYAEYPGALDMTEELAVQLRSGRPAVVLVDDWLSRDSSHLTEAVVRAIDMAARQDADTAWLENELRLPPWQVAKLFARSPLNQADFTITCDRMLGDSGLSAIDALAPVVGLAPGVSTNAPLRCLQLNSASLAMRTALFHGVDRQAAATRPVDLSKVGNFQLVMGRVHREKAWQALESQDGTAEVDLETWLKKLDLIVDQTPRHETGMALVQLAESSFRSGRWDRWQAVLERAVAQGAQSDTGRWSALERLKAGASNERVAWEISLRSEREHARSRESIQTASASVPIASLTTGLQQTPFENEMALQAAGPASPLAAATNVQPASGRSQVVTASAEQPAAGTDGAEQSVALRLAALRRAVRDYGELCERDLALARRPDIQLAHFAHRRGLAELAGEPVPDPTALQMIAAGPPLAGWPQVAEQELALASGRRTLSNWTARAQFTPERPQLDGRGDEPLWQRALPIALTSPFDPQSKLAASTARFAYDDEYLYVLLACPILESRLNDSKPRELRKYDMALEATDHVQLLLDTDRDYTSGCELAVNDAGHTFDRCCGASQWNPRWYVAVDTAQRSWTAELAIRLSDLTTAPSVTGRAWAISAFRYIPGVDVQSWSQLRSYQPRYQGNGLLVFDP